MDQFCGSPFWDANLTWNTTTEPDFTPCFQETVLAWAPCLLLWLFVWLELVRVHYAERRYVQLTLLNSFRIFFTIVLCILSLLEYLNTLLIEHSHQTYMVYYVSPIIKASTYILVFVLLEYNRRKGVQTSGLLFVFWLLSAIVSIINLRSLIKSTFYSDTHVVAAWKVSELIYTSRLVSTFIVLVQLVLSCIADKRAQDPFLLTGEDHGTPSPEYEASFLSQITFFWLDPLMWLGYRRTLTQADLYALSRRYRSECLAKKFDSCLNPQIKKALELKGNSKIGAFDSIVEQGNTLLPKSQESLNAQHVGVVGIMFKTFWPSILWASLLKSITSLLTFSSPLILDLMLMFVKSKDEPVWRGYLYAFSLFSLQLLGSILENKQEYLSNLNVMLIKTSLTSVIYKKSLKISSNGRRNFTTGQIVNIMSVDVQRVADLVQNLANIWSVPLQLTLAIYLIHQQLGNSVLAGLSILLLSMFFNGWVTSKMKDLQQIIMKLKDYRIKQLSELLNGIKMIKFHAWERPFKKKIDKIREDEIRVFTDQTWYSSALAFSFTSLPFIVSLASFATYVLSDSSHILDANKVFVSLSLFNLLRFPLILLPMILTNLSLFFVSVKRINSYLEADEIDPNFIKPIKEDGLAIKIENASFKWSKNDENNLEKIDIRVPKGKLYAIIGNVGSGKSSLISAMLGNMDKIEGEVFMDLNASVSYVPQEAWILKSSIKDNILLNKVYDDHKYQKVIDSCALGPDLKILDKADQTDAQNLSGGQKQRVSLARAIYADSDIYLMDDPLNAVDSYVGRHIFDSVIGPKSMLRDRTRILVTNKLSFLPEVDYIFMMKEGRIVEYGTYEELISHDTLLNDLLVKYLDDYSEKSFVGYGKPPPEVLKQELEKLNLVKLKQDSKDSNIVGGDTIRNKQQYTIGQESQSKENQEVTQIGSVGLDVHIKFIKTMGISFVIAQALYIISSAFTLSSNFWLSEWANDAENATLTNDTSLRNLRLGVYAGLGLSEVVLIIVSSFLLNYACLQGSKVLHGNMLGKILKAPVSWFDATPSGRILNRFSKDIDTVDSTIRMNVRLLSIITLRTISSLILISIGSVYSLIFIIPILFLYILFQIFYVSTSRQLKRIESATRSPVFTHFSETIVGATSIRAFNIVREFVLESNHRVDLNNMSFYTGFVAARWLSIRLEFLGYIIVLVASLVVVLSKGSISVGVAGLSVSYALTITTVMSMLVRTFSDYETNVVSVERLLEYTRIPSEPEEDEKPLDPKWPSKGKILFENFSTKYRPELDLVLRKINLLINPMEKIGFVGRTGAGKSSVSLALFRFLEAVEGQVAIDDVNIAHISLKLLRSRLSIIPQQPILFTGTIRINIDPSDSYSDDDLWRSLDMAHLGPLVRSFSDGLDHEVLEGGSNLSVGQKQLLCLARALLRKSKILVLDEATASVDVETDDLIQKTIRKEFSNSTILTIAHRLETLQDYDRIVVMDRGEIVETGTPQALMKNSRSKYNEVAKEMK